MMDAEPLHARYVLTAEDLLRALREGSAADLRKQRRLVFGCAAFIGVLFLVNYVVNGEISPFIGVLALSTSVAAFFVPALYERRLRKHVEGADGIGRTVAITLSEDRLRVETAGVSDWSMVLPAVQTIEDRPGGLFLRLSDLQGTWVPDRAFTSLEDREAFFRRLRAGTPIPEAAIPA